MYRGNAIILTNSQVDPLRILVVAIPSLKVVPRLAHQLVFQGRWSVTLESVPLVDLIGLGLKGRHRRPALGG